MESQDKHVDASGNPVITLQEALEEYEQLEKVSTAVLGGSDPSNCSYSKGYLHRQALYACMTCNPMGSPDFQPAGICLGCSYKCHDGHELVELYTKRNFRCDCGNKKFPGHPCVLQAEKDDLNKLNSYNQNFKGLYCTCHRPYPDPEESGENADPMVQCVLCEDWLHTQHAIPGVSWSDYDNDEDEQSVELICGSCMVKVDFLGHYGSLQAKAVEKIDVSAEPSAPMDAEKLSIDDSSSTVVANQSDAKPLGNSEGIEDSTSQDSGIASLTDPDVPPILKVQEDVSRNSKDMENQTRCFRTRFPKTDFEVGKGTLWSDGWRTKLCRCAECLAMYENLQVGYLIEENDTIESYETTGKANTDSEMLRAEESFNKQVDALGRVGQIELVAGFNDIKEALKDYLKDFATNGQVVQEKDIVDFFENYRAAKRARLDANFKY